MISPIEARLDHKAHLAAVGFSSFHTKNRIIPRSGIQQKDKILTAQFGASGFGTTWFVIMISPFHVNCFASHMPCVIAELAMKAKIYTMPTPARIPVVSLLKLLLS